MLVAIRKQQRRERDSHEASMARLLHRVGYQHAAARVMVLRVRYRRRNPSLSSSPVISRGGPATLAISDLVAFEEIIEVRQHRLRNELPNESDEGTLISGAIQIMKGIKPWIVLR